MKMVEASHFSVMLCSFMIPLLVLQWIRPKLFEVEYSVLHGVRISLPFNSPGLFSSRLHVNIQFISQIFSTFSLILLEKSL